MVDRVLYGIFKKMLNDETYMHHPNTRNILEEYILYLISFKNDDNFLHPHLRSLEEMSRMFPGRLNPDFRMLSQEVSRFVDKRSWDTNGQMDEFRTALRKLEEDIYMRMGLTVFMS